MSLVCPWRIKKKRAGRTVVRLSLKGEKKTVNSLSILPTKADNDEDS